MLTRTGTGAILPAFRHASGRATENATDNRETGITMKTLDDLYLDQLKDLYAACKQTMPLVTEMGRATTSLPLSEALIAANQSVAQGMEVLARICTDHDTDPTDRTCKGLEALICEARQQAVGSDFPDEVQDAMIVAQYRRLCHYTIAGYDSLCGLATRLGHVGDGAALQECLDRLREGDGQMIRLVCGSPALAVIEGGAG